ncbi:hypothetical protein GYMLUDRAFT_776452 [Collybiopsis luxurians FD-317 M1]|uniref:DUF6533 domain-containing protein n=1 Tax=Collybiopsis luxurians FD-317 M1 TaxID=944289 RepID=A0A0D0B1D3_9AGAR|nr:hypothetical protein GYMLUDRAFT_776452 [Collybiopsis luxurians FD-317 M1]
MSSVPVPVSGIDKTYLYMQWAAYFQMAATTLVFWDYVLTFEGELELIWRRKKTGVSFLFISNRYLAIIAQLLTTYTHVSSNVTYSVSKFAIAYWLIGTSLLQLILTDGIVWLCVCALYGNSKRIRWPLLGLLIACVLGGTAVIGVVGSRTKGSAEITPGIRRCTVDTQFHGLWLYWIPILIYETTTLILVMRLFIQYLQNRRAWALNLLRLLLKDMLLYLAVIFASFVTNAVLFSNPDPILAGLVEPVTVVLLSILGNRMLLNLRAENKRAEEGMVFESGVQVGERSPGNRGTQGGESDRRRGTETSGPALQSMRFAEVAAESRTYV